ncbi:hypothetical protein Tco_0587648 [Tanacetum coccineum]
MRGIGRLKTKRELVRITIDDGNTFWKEIGDNAVVLVKLLLNLMLPVQVNVVEGDFINTLIKGSTPSYDQPQSGEDGMQLSELMNLCTNLQEKVLDLEKAKTAQAKEIASLKKRVKQWKREEGNRPSGLRRLRNGWFNLAEGRWKFAFERWLKSPVVSCCSTQSHSFSAGEVVTTTTSVEIPDELTLAQTLIEIKSTKPKAVTTDATTVTSVRPWLRELLFH